MVSPDPISFDSTGLWLVPLVLLLTLAGLALVIRSWRGTAVGDLKAARGQLRQIQGELRQIQSATTGFKAGDPEPYGSRARSLLALLSQLQTELKQLDARYVGLQERVSWLTANRWQALTGGPYFWYRLRQEASALERELAAARELLEQAGQLAQGLQRVGWEVALQARRVFTSQQQVKQLFEALRAQGLHGSQVDSAENGWKEVREALGQIPVYYLSADQPGVLEQADQESITGTYAILGKAEKALEGLAEQAHSWKNLLLEANQKLNTLQRNLANASRTLSNAPAEFDTADFQRLVGEIEAQTEPLRLSLEKPQVDKLGEELERIDQMIQAVVAARSQFGQRRQDLASLMKATGKLNSGLRESAARCAALASHPRHPVQLSSSQTRLKELQLRVDALETEDQKFDADSLQRQLLLAREAEQQFMIFASRLAEMEGQHSELSLILDSPELSQIETWLASARQAARRIESYAPENWPRKTELSDLPAALQNLEVEATRLGLKDPGSREAIPEEELPQRLVAARELSSGYQNINRHLEVARGRLEQLQDQEQQADEAMVGAQAALNQIAFIVRSNPYLAGSVEGDLQRRLAEVSSLQAGLEDRSQGKVESKARQANSLSARVEKSANRWLAQIIKETQAQVKGISELLAELDEIAPVEEAAVGEARRLAAETGQVEDRGGSLTTAGEGAGRRIGQLVPEFKKFNDLWQRCVATQNALADVMQPITSGYSRADQARQAAWQALELAVAWLKQRGNWPPTSVTLEPEQQEIKVIESEWQALKKTPERAIHLAQKLVDLSARFQALADKVHRSADQAAREMGELEEVEADLAELAQGWQNQWYAYRDEPDVSGEIGGLLGEIEATLKGIRAKHKRKTMSYSQASQAVKDLYRKVRFYQVALDADHSIDAVGNVRRRK